MHVMIENERQIIIRNWQIKIAFCNVDILKIRDPQELAEKCTVAHLVKNPPFQLYCLVITTQQFKKDCLVYAV